jgi:hypothetical protein
MTKRITLALAMIGLSVSAFAGAPGNQVAMPSGVNLIAPDSVGVWSFGIEALYMMPGNRDYQYGSLNTDTTATVSPFKNESVNADHDWGGTVDATYLFAGSSRDVKLSYTHLHFSDSDHTTVGDNQSFSPSLSLFYNGPLNFNAAGDTARASFSDSYDALDLVFGQWIRVGERVDLHPFAGVRYASVNQSNKATYTDISATAPDNYASQQLKSDFEGIGPRAGIDTAVHLGSGFSIVGTMGASLLIGSMESKLNVYDPATAGIEYWNYRNDDSTHVVPELDARLGVDYMYAFTPTTSMNIQLGYQAVNYFDVANLDGIDTYVPNTVNNSEDFGYQGPYLRLQLNLA